MNLIEKLIPVIGEEKKNKQIIVPFVDELKSKRN